MRVLRCAARGATSFFGERRASGVLRSVATQLLGAAAYFVVISIALAAVVLSAGG